MSDANEFELINFDVDEFLRKDIESNAFRLPPWSDPDKKIADYKRRREKHIVIRDDYHARFIQYKIMLKKTKTGDKENKPPTKSFYDFAEKVSCNTKYH